MGREDKQAGVLKTWSQWETLQKPRGRKRGKDIPFLINCTRNKKRETAKTTSEREEGSGDER